MLGMIKSEKPMVKAELPLHFQRVVISLLNSGIFFCTK